MYVNRLTMQNFRGISDLTLEFEPNKPTVFIGINGVGKSSILDCLAILLSWMLARIQHEPRDFSSLASSFRRKGELANGSPFIESDIKNNCAFLICDIEVLINDFEAVYWLISKSKQDEQRLERAYDLSSLNNFTKQVRETLQTNRNISIPLVVYYSISRSLSKITLDLPDKSLIVQTDAYENALEKNNITFASFFQWFRLVEDLENEERRDNIEYRDRPLEAVRKAIYSMLGEQFSRLRVRRSPLRMTIEKQDQELTVNQLSDGEKGLLAMVGDLARRLAIANPGLDDPLQGSAVVLIDEIEQHLHPAWQRRVIPNLIKTFPNCQFIVTTHSPQVISQVQPESIYILQSVDDNIVAKRPESSFGRDSNRILEDLMGVAERPQEIKDRLLELFRVIDKGNLARAKIIRQELARDIGGDEPEFVRADILMRRREILNR